MYSISDSTGYASNVLIVRWKKIIFLSAYAVAAAASPSNASALKSAAKAVSK
jgi:hypothetical protein